MSSPELDDLLRITVRQAVQINLHTLQACAFVKPLIKQHTCYFFIFFILKIAIVGNIGDQGVNSKAVILQPRLRKSKVSVEENATKGNLLKIASGQAANKFGLLRQPYPSFHDGGPLQLFLHIEWLTEPNETSGMKLG
eukprot:jgi/Botrbrau1/7393/Bobra.0316s0034.1